MPSPNPSPTSPVTSAPGRFRRALGRVYRHFTDGDPVVAALAVVIVVYYCVQPGIFEGKASGDGMVGFLYLPSLYYHHSFDTGLADAAYLVPRFGHGPTGHVPNPCPIGTLPFWIPFYLVGLGLKWLAGLVVTLPREPVIGKSAFDFWMAALGSLFAGLSGIGMLFRLVKRKLGVGAARFGVLGAVLATPILWYFTVQPLYQHACAFWSITLFVVCWDRWRGAMTLRRWAALGAIGGLAMLIRFQEGVWLILPAMDLAAQAWRERRELRSLVGRGIDGLVFVGIVVAVFAPQLLLWKYFAGAMRPPQPPGHMRWGNPALLATLWSTRAGLLTWSPILYLVVPGLLLARRRLAGLAWRMALVLCLVWWTNASAWDHWGSYTFGARRFTDATIVFALGLGGLWAVATATIHSRRRRAWMAGLATACVLATAWNGLLMELVRQHKVKSSGAWPYPASTWAQWAGAPPWMVRALQRVGYPFVQPAGWLYSLLYHVPANTYEGIVGGYLLERDWRIHESVSVPSVNIDSIEGAAFIVEGIGARPEKGWPGGLAPTLPRMRALIPLVAREPLRVRITGQFGGREREVRTSWNGVALQVVPGKNEVRFQVAETLVYTRARLNDLVVTGIPPGTRLNRIEFESTTRWWDK